MRLGLYPNLGVAWYWACLVGEGRPLVTVIDHEVPLPDGAVARDPGRGPVGRPHRRDAVRARDASAARRSPSRVDDPAEVYGDLRGDRVPFGLDLEWETDGGGVYPWIGTTRYEVPCTVHGEILVGDETIDFDGFGQRDHSWGVRDWWSFGWVWTAGRLDDGTRFHTTRHPAPRPRGVRARLRACRRAAACEQIDVCTAEEELGAHGFPTSAQIRCGQLDLAVEPVAFSPVHLVDDDRTAQVTPASPGPCAASRRPTVAPGSAGPSGTSRRRADAVRPAPAATVTVGQHVEPHGRNSRLESGVRSRSAS